MVLVTGASRGLGSSIVEIFAQHGYNIILNYCTNKEKAIAVKDKMMGDYSDRMGWAKKMLVNTAKAGFFSSDRTIAEYNNDIWKL